MKKLRITVLVENVAPAGDLMAEHGLSVWIESGHGCYLFDTGQDLALGANAPKLGITPAMADSVILSHGHYDHTGGLPHVLGLEKCPPVYAHPDAFEPKYACGPGRVPHDIGMPHKVKDLVKSRAEIRPVRVPTEVADGLFITGPIPRRNDYEDSGGPFFADAECTVPDEFRDDQAVFIDTPGGVVVLLGCAHAGVVNTLEYIRELTAGSRIRAVMGGMHLLSAGPVRMDKTVAGLKDLAVQEFYPFHCTGREAVDRLYREFPQRCFPFSTGTVFTLEG